MMKDLTSEIDKRKRAAWGACKRIADVVKRTNIWLRAHLLSTTFLPAFTYSSEKGVFRKQGENASASLNVELKG
ncbi:hypothetical protein RB195_009464 [Necator americanus]|uniref:Uncharacterized protein n=1 Tax=Necator americanus TaxID=51031 RepID=A0ABR1CUR4_NECAM